MDRESTTGLPAPGLRLAIAAGGTGGHISPVVAVLEEFERRGLALETLWIGSADGFERDTARDLSIPFRSIQVGKLRRYVSLQTVPDALRIPIGVLQARRILSRFEPHVVFSTGGYVGVPPIVAARTLGKPSLTHEQTAILGLATRINARFTDTIALSYPSTPHPKTRSDCRILVSGNPVRTSLFGGDPAAAFRHFGLPGKLPLVYVTGGAQGASGLNRIVLDALPELLQTCEIVHQCGPNERNGDYDRLKKVRRRLPPDLAACYVPVERVGAQLGDIYAAATLVVGRSGAGTVAELAAFGLPSILIPLPGAEEAHRNALVLRDSGAAVVHQQSQIDGSLLTTEINRHLSNPKRLEEMSKSARGIAAEAPAAKLADELLNLATRTGYPAISTSSPVRETVRST